MIDIFQQIQHAVAGCILSIPYLNGVGVFIMRPHVQPDGTVVDAPSIQTAIENSLLGIQQRNSMSGAAAMVLMPRLGIEDHLASNTNSKIHLVVRVAENVLINNSTGGTFLSAEAIADRIRQELHFFQAGSKWKIKCEEQNTILPIDDGDPNNVTYEVQVFCFHNNTNVSRVTMPTIAVAGGNCTLSCTTAGSSIYYTTDGTFPYSGNTGATLYAAPFAVASGDHVKVCAFASNLSPSGVVEGVVT